MLLLTFSVDFFNESPDFGAMGQTHGSVPPLREAWECQAWDKSQESSRRLCSEPVLRAGETFQVNSLMLNVGCTLVKCKFGGNLLFLG